MGLSTETEAAQVRMLSYGMIAVAGFLVIFLRFVNAPYGRYGSPKWGPAMNSRLAWFIWELPSFCVPAIMWVMNDKPVEFINMVLLGLFMIHYTQRTFIFPFLIRGGKPIPLITVLVATAYCCYNGYIQAAYQLHVAKYPDGWLSQPCFLVGTVVFFLGMGINIHSDHILRNLRKPGETGYKIPQGGMFEYVSGANFFGEILEWTGFTIACWSLPALAFLIYTACNIGPRAIAHHDWYLEKFKDNYPKNRTALLPFIL